MGSMNMQKSPLNIITPDKGIQKVNSVSVALIYTFWVLTKAIPTSTSEVGFGAKITNYPKLSSQL